MGFEIEQSEDCSMIRIHQEQYANKVLRELGMEDCKPGAVPADPYSKLVKPDGCHKQEETFSLRKLIGLLIYLITHTRPDLAWAVGYLAQFVENFDQTHELAAKRILRYLKRTVGLGITYGDFAAEDKDVLFVFSDADHAGCLVTRRSTSGVVAIFNGGPVIWSSRRQTCVATSTMEAEFVAASSAAKEVEWCRSTLKELGAEQEEPTSLFIDNQAAIALIRNSSFPTRAKHIDIHFRKASELHEEGVLRVEDIGTDDQVADILTKPLPPIKFEGFKRDLNLF